MLSWTIIGGGLVGLFFTPVIHGRFRIQSLEDLIFGGGPLLQVSGSLLGAVITTCVVILVTPRESATSASNSKPESDNMTS